MQELKNKNKNNIDVNRMIDNFNPDNIGNLQRIINTHPILLIKVKKQCTVLDLEMKPIN